MLSTLVFGLKQMVGAWRWWALSAFVLIFDQFTKIWANTVLIYDQPLGVFPSFNLTLRYNHGAAFSFLHDQSGWQRWLFAVIASVASVALMAWVTRIYRMPNKRLETCALSLILSGALGNLYDRVAYGYVIDFLEVYYQTYYWPAFNIADSAICVGAGLIILDVVLPKKTDAA